MGNLLERKVALITGGAKGIGRSIVETFTSEGSFVSFIDKDDESGSKLEQQLKLKSPNLFFQHGDVTDLQTVEDFIETTVKKFGRLDILINNAGVNDFVGLEASPQEFLDSLNRNLYHYFYTAHFALPYLKKTQGTIINISSKVAFMGEGHTSGYAAAKGGVNGLTAEWAFDLTKYGIRVNAIVPAIVSTPQAQEYFKNHPEAEKKAKKRVPFGKRLTTPKEIADTALFLASDLSSHYTGEFLRPNGGYFLETGR